MPTESYSLAEAIPSYTGTLGNERTTFARSGKTLKYWKTAMLAGGWTEYASVKAGVTVSLDFSKLPVRTPEPAGGDADKDPGSIVCTQHQPAIIVTMPGGEIKKIWGWDPGKYTEPPCEHFAYGNTQDETFEIFKPTLSEAMGMGILGVFQTGNIVDILLESLFPGPDDNGMTVDGWVRGAVWYGGYNLRTPLYRNRFLSVTGREGPGMSGGPQYHAWEMDVKVHLGDDDFFGQAPLRFDLWMDPARSSAYPWRIVVCPYQFAIWMDLLGDGDSSIPYPRSAMVSLPWVPDGFTGHSCFAFAATSQIANFRSSLQWQAFTWFDNGPWCSTDGSFAGVIVPVLRTRSLTQTPVVPDRITTTQGLLVTDNAWVTGRRDINSIAIVDHRLAGKLWNCATVTDNYPASTMYSQMMDATWVHVSSQGYYPDYATAPFLNGSQKASLWWKVTAGDVIPPEA